MLSVNRVSGKQSTPPQGTEKGRTLVYMSAWVLVSVCGHAET